MSERFLLWIDRINRAQKGLRFRIAAMLVALALVGTLAGLAATGRANFLPESMRLNLVSTAVTASLVGLAIIWLNQTLTLLFTAVAAAAIISVIRLVAPELAALWQPMVLGTASMTVTFLAAVELIRRALGAAWHPLAIARLLLDEAIRMKIALIFIISLIVFIPLLASRLDPSQPLRYRVQTFVSYGTGLGYSLLAVMTLFVSTASVAFEQRDKQIYQVVTKPVTRAGYIMGKWLGVMALNGLLLAMIGGSVFWFTQYLRTLPAHDAMDALAVSEQVLTARVGAPPSFPVDEWNRESMARAEEELRTNPELEHDYATIKRLGDEHFQRLRTQALTVEPTKSRQYTFKGIRPVSRTIRAVIRPGELIDLGEPVRTVFDVSMKSEDGSITFNPGVHYQIATDFRRLRARPVEEQTDAKVKLTEGQRVVIKYFPANALTLRYAINSGDNDPGLTFRITFNVITAPLPFFEVREVALVQTQTWLIPAGAVTENGELVIEVINGDVETGAVLDKSITFPPDGLEVMYKVGGFEGNFLRAMLVVWVKLGFLAMLGIAAATFTSFPVACMIAFAVFFGAETGPYLAQALDYYQVTDPMTEKTNFFKVVIKWIATGANAMLAGYGQIRPTQNLIDGRLVSWGLVGKTFLLIGLAWTGLTGLVGWAAFRSRQLATYSGHA